MLLEMKVPSPGESISEVEILEWLVKDGDFVEKDQSIAEIDSDKATLELPAEESGKINILVEEGKTISVGDIVCTIDTSVKIDNNSISKEPKIEKARIEKELVTNDEVSPSITPRDNSEKVHKKTPLAAAMIDYNKIDEEDIKGTGNHGKIMKSDIEKALSTEKKSGFRSKNRKKMSTLRKKIASRLVAVKNETAMLTTFNEVDMSEIINIRNKYKEKFKAKYSVSLGFMSFFTKAVTTSVNDYNDVNSMIDGNEIIQHNYVDVGIAVSAPKGLMVPVLKNAEMMSFKEIELQISYLADKARNGKITIDEMSGGTFTITNGGVFGSMLATPIINPPQSAILGMHNIVERAVVVKGEIVIKPIMYVALSYDHRIIDGRESVGFLCRVKECLENPKEHLMNNNIMESLEL